MARFSVIVVAAGRGTRAGLGRNKLLFCAGGKSVLEHTLACFPAEIEKIVVAAADELDAVRAVVGDGVAVTVGGATRADSVQAGLACCKTEFVLVHDGARPCLHPSDLARIVRTCEERGACLPYAVCNDTLRIDGVVADRGRAQLASTPQAFSAARLREAYARADRAYTDDAGVYEACFGPCPTLALEYPNPKLTTRGDLEAWARTFSRVGCGYDEHRLAEGRKCVLCGVTLPVGYGPLGHSDADVALHALIDAMLGAAGLPDIGTLFPDTDPAYEGIDSAELLARTVAAVRDAGYVVGNCSLTLHAQRPRLAPYIDAFRTRLSELVGIARDAIGIGATSGEGMGHIGRGEGIACYAVCSLVPLVQ